jgi:hypothetical protein
MSLDEPVVKSAYRPRSAAQKQRRLELKVIRADERYRARYQALKAEMAASGHAIGTIRDLDEMFANDPRRRYEVLKARVDRWDALWSITKRKRETRAEIVLGGAVLAELHSPTLSDELMNAIMDALSAHQALSRQALESAKVREGLKDILLGPGQLYEALRQPPTEPGRTHAGQTPFYPL